MVTRTLVVTPQLGLHAKPAGLFVNEANKFKSEIKVSKDGLDVNGKSVLGLMLLAAEMGSRLKITVSGPDEKQAMDALAKLFEKKFDED